MSPSIPISARGLFARNAVVPAYEVAFSERAHGAQFVIVRACASSTDPFEKSGTREELSQTGSCQMPHKNKASRQRHDGGGRQSFMASHELNGLAGLPFVDVNGVGQDRPLLKKRK